MSTSHSRSWTPPLPPAAALISAPLPPAPLAIPPRPQQPPALPFHCLRLHPPLHYTTNSTMKTPLNRPSQILLPNQSCPGRSVPLELSQLRHLTSTKSIRRSLPRALPRQPYGTTSVACIASAAWCRRQALTVWRSAWGQQTAACCRAAPKRASSWRRSPTVSS